MGRYAAGDEGAFGQVYDHLGPRLYRFLLRQCGDPQLAEDVLQQTLMKMHAFRGTYLRGAPVTPWAFAIARRLLIDELRRQRREPAGPLEDPEVLMGASPSAEDAASARQLGRQLKAVFEQLPPRQQQAFLLVRQDGLTQAEAAQVLCTTVMAVKLLLHRVTQRLKGRLHEQQSGEKAS